MQKSIQNEQELSKKKYFDKDGFLTDKFIHEELMKTKKQLQDIELPFIKFCNVPQTHSPSLVEKLQKKLKELVDNAQKTEKLTNTKLAKKNLEQFLKGLPEDQRNKVLNYQDPQFRVSIMHVVAEMGDENIDLAEIILKYNPNLTLTNCFNQTPIDRALVLNQKKMVLFLCGNNEQLLQTAKNKLSKLLETKAPFFAQPKGIEEINRLTSRLSSILLYHQFVLNLRQLRQQGNLEGSKLEELEKVLKQLENLILQDDTAKVDLSPKLKSF